ncbi:MAG: ornithine cyclodeaminase family protein [Halobacteriaceae archaeon]
METLVLDHEAVAEHAPLSAVTEAVEAAFGAYATGDATMPAKSYVDLPQYNGDFRAMPAHVEAESFEGAGMKWVNAHPDNPREHGLPTVMATLVYSDPETGFPLALLDGTELTGRRTGAAAAVATRHLAGGDATSMGLVGAGAQSYTQLEAVSLVCDIEEVVVHDRDGERARALVEAFEDRFDARTGSVREAGHCDVLSTVTPVREPVVGAEDVGEHTHVNAMGADAPGKHELADAILQNAKLVIDDYEQCTHSGEINVPWGAGALTDDDIHATLGEVVAGTAEGRTPADGVTVFDSTGLAIQDIAAAHVAYERARAAGDGDAVDLLGV